MNIEKISNTTVQIPDREVKPGEVISNVQICPIGDFPNGDRNQHCTAEALQNVVKDWQKSGSKEILVDFEHNSESHEPNSDTSAAAWVSNVRVDPARGTAESTAPRTTSSGSSSPTSSKARPSSSTSSDPLTTERRRRYNTDHEERPSIMERHARGQERLFRRVPDPRRRHPRGRNLLIRI